MAKKRSERPVLRDRIQDLKRIRAADIKGRLLTGAPIPQPSVRP